MVCTWIELDVWARPTGKRFDGTVEQLQAKLQGEVSDGRFSLEVRHQLLLVAEPDYLCERVHTSVLTMSTPWGQYRWIPRPQARPRRRWAFF